MASRRCEALYDYNATDNEELTIKKGEKLSILSSDGTWWEVTNDRNITGLVPCNYVKELPEEQMRTHQQPSPAQFRMHPEEPAGMYQQTDLVKTANSFLNIPAVAKYRYVAKRDDELGLEKGDSLVVLEKEQDGWWRGRCGNRIGWFPFNYVEELPPSSLVEQRVEKAVICTVVALYPFNSGNPEELAFNKGDILEIIDQPQDDPDWWEARMTDGKTGLIPRNYVEQVMEGSKPKSPIGAQGGWSGQPTAPQPSSSMIPLGGGGGSGSPPFSRESWYFGKLSRKDAERRLNSDGQDGQFLVRESETKVRFRKIMFHVICCKNMGSFATCTRMYTSSCAL